MAAKKAPAKRPAPAQDKLNAAGVETIAGLIASGESYRKIAAKYAVGIGRLFDWIEAEPERAQACARARETSAQTWDELAEHGIAEAGDAFEFAKARELAVHYRWRAKAANPKRYGDRQTIDANITHSADSIIAAVAAARKARGL